MMADARATHNVIRAHYKTLRPAPAFLGNEVIMVRHAETIAEVFPDWIERCKLGTTEFHPFDLNMPVRIPLRPDMQVAYRHDPPLSEIGRIITQVFARELIVRNAIPKVIYSSPTLASIQTAVDIQNFLGKQGCRICVDASLASDQGSATFWLTKKSMLKLNYKINESYVPRQLESPHMDSVVSNMKKLVRTFSKMKELVLVVSDSLAISVMSDIISGVEKKYDQPEEQLRREAESAFPPMSSITFSPSKQSGTTQLEPSRIYLRPLTSIGDSSQPVYDGGCIVEAES